MIMKILLLLATLSYSALGFNKTELITPSQCTEVIHYKFDGDQEGTYNIRIRPKAFPDQAFPDVCELVFAAFDPWNDMLFSFSHCDIGEDGPCKEEDTRYSHIREDSLIVSVANEDTLMLITTYDEFTSAYIFSNEKNITSLGARNVSIVISGADVWGKDWALYFKISSAHKPSFEFSKAAGIFTLALASVSAFILLVLFCRLLCSKGCNRGVRRSNQPLIRRTDTAPTRSYGAVPQLDRHSQVNALNSRATTLQSPQPRTLNREPTSRLTTVTDVQQTPPSTTRSQQPQGVVNQTIVINTPVITQPQTQAAPPAPVENPHLQRERFSRYEPPPTYESVQHLFKPVEPYRAPAKVHPHYPYPPPPPQSAYNHNSGPTTVSHNNQMCAAMTNHGFVSEDVPVSYPTIEPSMLPGNGYAADPMGAIVEASAPPPDLDTDDDNALREAAGGIQARIHKILGPAPRTTNVPEGILVNINDHPQPTDYQLTSQQQTTTIHQSDHEEDLMFFTPTGSPESQ